MQTKEASKAPSGRTRRKPLSGKQPLAVRGKEPGFQYRVVNDIDDRVLSFEEAGYEVVTDKDVSVGDKRVDKSSELGSVKEFSVGGGQRAVLMRIPDEWYQEDQAAKQQHVKALEDSTRKDALSGHYGKLDLTRD